MNMFSTIMEDIDPNIRSKNLEKKTQRKLKRLQYLISNDAGIVCSNDPTKVSVFIYTLDNEWE